MGNGIDHNVFNIAFHGALINKSEASLSVIKAGVDEKGNPLCVNKSQVYLFKKDQAGNKIIFYYMMPKVVMLP